MIKTTVMMAIALTTLYVKEEGLTNPNIVGDRLIEQRAAAADACATAYAASSYAVSNPVTLTSATAKIAGNATGMNVRWTAGSIQQAPALDIDCYAIGPAVVQMSVNGDTFISRQL